MKLNLQVYHFQMYANYSPGAHIFQHFLTLNSAKYRSKFRFQLFSWNVSTGFKWNLSYKLIGATFVGLKDQS